MEKRQDKDFDQGELNEQVIENMKADIKNQWREEDQVINLRDNQDFAFIKSLNEIISAYQILSQPQSREAYLKKIRLRSFASQYMNTFAAEKDGFIYPFLLFSVQENNYGNNNEIG